MESINTPNTDLTGEKELREYHSYYRNIDWRQESIRNGFPSVGSYSKTYTLVQENEN